MTEQADVVPPVVCTLVDGELSTRGLEWNDVGALSLTAEGIESGVVTTYPIEIADQIEDLCNREIGCCGSWLNIETSRLDQAIRVEITTSNPDGLGIIRSIAGLTSDD
ncbi:MAG: hypothetical protein ACC652_04730 [Acidimicrobiales bacterium]